MANHPPRRDRRARWRGGLAGLVPTLAIGLFFVIGPTSATPPEVATSLGLVGVISIVAGWLAGPLAAGSRHRLLVASMGYAIALIATTAALAIIQGTWETVATNGPDPLAIATTIVGRAFYSLAGTAYLIVPALVLGGAWSVVARGLMRLDGSR